MPLISRTSTGEYWVNFRLASITVMGRSGKSTPAQKADVLRHLNAAVAARPNSAVARTALGTELSQRRKDDPTGMQMLRAAADMETTSAWPGVFLGMAAVEGGNWSEATAAYVKAVRADPDTAFAMIGSLTVRGPGSGGPGPTEQDIARMCDALVAASHGHPGAYTMRGSHRQATGDYRGALADYRKASTVEKPDYPLAGMARTRATMLEPMARWEGKLPAVLRGELKPTTGAEFADLAGYCAGFDKRYALAARFAADGLAADPGLYANAQRISDFAGWSVQAGVGHGADAADLTAEERARLRRQALAWLRQAVDRPASTGPGLRAALLRTNPDLRPVRDAAELAKLPPDERGEWDRFWKGLQTTTPKK